jgi:hypothetical protein
VGLVLVKNIAHFPFPLPTPESPSPSSPVPLTFSEETAMRLFTLAAGLVAICGLAMYGARNLHADNPQPDKSKLNDGQNAPRFDAARFLKDHDKNGDGKLSKDELPSAAQKEFDKIDTNKDGFISQD